MYGNQENKSLANGLAFVKMPCFTGLGIHTLQHLAGLSSLSLTRC